MKQTRTQRIMLAELSMTGVFHAGVNAGFIRLMHEVYPAAALHFVAEKSHAEACRERIGGLPVRFRRFPFFPKASKWTLPVRDLLGCVYVLWLFLVSRNGDMLFVTNLLPVTHGCACLLNALFRHRLFIALHGQLEAFRPGTPLRFTKPYFRLHGPLFRRYVILGEPVYEVVKQLFLADNKPVVIDHPYDYGEETPPPSLEFPLRFGQIGVGNRAKGTEKLFQLGELLQDEIEAGRVELHLAGRLDPELRPLANRWVKWHAEPLPENEFAQKISGLHYALLLRAAADGCAVASGSFFDSVKYGKPSVKESLKHDKLSVRNNRKNVKTYEPSDKAIKSLWLNSKEIFNANLQ